MKIKDVFQEKEPRAYLVRMTKYTTIAWLIIQIAIGLIFFIIEREFTMEHLLSRFTMFIFGSLVSVCLNIYFTKGNFNQASFMK